MSGWTHSICWDCWLDRHEAEDRIEFRSEGDRVVPMLRMPTRIKREYVEQVRCCFCATTHRSGIWLRENPEKTLCHGDHYASGGMIMVVDIDGVRHLLGMEAEAFKQKWRNDTAFFAACVVITQVGEELRERHAD